MYPAMHPEAIAKPFHCCSKLLAPQGSWGIFLSILYLTRSLSAQTTSGVTRAWRQTLTFPQAGGKSVTLWVPITGMCQQARHSGSTLHAPPAQEGTRRLMERRHSREE